MDELIARLRATDPCHYDTLVNPDGPEAATLIEQLRAENARLREALRKIAGNGNATGCNPLLMCDIAVAALQSQETTHDA